MKKIASITILSFLALILLNSCEAFKPKKVDARKVSPNAKIGLQKILKKEEVLSFLEEKKVESLNLLIRTPCGAPLLIQLILCRCFL